MPIAPVPPQCDCVQSVPACFSLSESLAIYPAEFDSVANASGFEVEQMAGDPTIGHSGPHTVNWTYGSETKTELIGGTIMIARYCGE